MHHKFIIGEGVVAFGSLNLTKNAFANNYENVFISRDIPLILSFAEEFDILWKHSNEVLISGGKIRSLTCPNCKREHGIDFESYGVLCTFCGHRFRLTEL